MGRSPRPLSSQSSYRADLECTRRRHGTGRSTARPAAAAHGRAPPGGRTAGWRQRAARWRRRQRRGGAGGGPGGGMDGDGGNSGGRGQRGAGTLGGGEAGPGGGAGGSGPGGGRAAGTEIQEFGPSYIQSCKWTCCAEAITMRRSGRDRYSSTDSRIARAAPGQPPRGGSTPTQPRTTKDALPQPASRGRTHSAGKGRPRKLRVSRP